MSAYRKFILEAKQPAKFVPANQKIQAHKKELAKLQKEMQRVTNGLSKISQSKTMPPKLKTARTQRDKAHQNFLRASIAFKQAQIQELNHPA